MPNYKEIYSATEFNSNNLDYYTVEAKEKRKTEEDEMNNLMDLYYPEIDLDEIIVSTEEYLNLKN